MSLTSPGLGDPDEWVWDSPPLFPLLHVLSSYLFFLPHYTGLLLPSSFPSGPHVHFTPEQETDRTHSDEVGRNKASSPTLSYEEYAEEGDGERVILFSTNAD